MKKRIAAVFVLSLGSGFSFACGSSEEPPSGGSGSAGTAGAARGGSAGAGTGGTTQGGTSGRDGGAGGDSGGAPGSGGAAGAAAGDAGAGPGGSGAGGGGAAGAGGDDGFGEPPPGSDVLCGERPGGEEYGEHVLRFETSDRSTAVQIRRVFDDSGVGESALYHLESFAVVHDEETTCIADDSLAYENTHHNWDDVAEADADGVHYRLEFHFDAGSTYRLLATAEDASVVIDEAVIPTGGPPFCWSCPSGAGIGISEVMVNNVSAHADEANEFEPWVELYNSYSFQDADLTGYTLSNDFADRERFSLDGLTIPGGGTLVIFADGDTDAGPLHANFRLASAGGEIVLTRPDGTTDGGFTYGSTPPDASFVFEWSTGTFSGTTTPTPGEGPPE